MDDLVLNVEKKIFFPIKEFIILFLVKILYQKNINFMKMLLLFGYQKIRKIGIENYEKAKIYVNTKYDEIKESYLNKRKEICELPDQLKQKFNEKIENQKNIKN